VETAEKPRDTVLKRLALPVATWAIAAAYIGVYLPRHFVALDEGELGQAVDRVLAGQLPHRDFDDIWSGGTALYHALAAHLLGNQLFSFRLALYAMALPWLGALYVLARRVATPIAAAVAVLVAVAWSIPNYPAAMPSWYVLFLATFGAVAVCRFLETEDRRWLLAAGASGGLAILAKVVGLYYLAAVALVLIAVERTRASDSTKTADRIYSGALTAALALFTLAVARFATRVPSTTAGPLLQYALPVALLCGALLRDEWQSPRHAPWQVRARTLTTDLLPLAIGAAVPIALFLIPYARTHAVHAWFDGVFLTPQRRFTSASTAPPGLETIVPALAWAFLLVPIRTKHPRAVASVVAAGLALVLALASRGGTAYATVWDVVQHATWCIVLAGVLLVRNNIKVFLLLSLTALCSLVRIPYAAPAYTFYFAPLAVLSVLAILSARPRQKSPLAIPATAFLALFAILLVNPGRFTAEGDAIPGGTRLLVLPRMSVLRVPSREALQYEALWATVNAHIAPDAALYAAPDCPQVEYVTQRANPTPVFLDFLDDPATHDARAVHAIEATTTGGAVVYHRPHASQLVDTVIEAALRARFPDSAVVGAFTVRWP
jgi:hypothetical protein